MQIPDYRTIVHRNDTSIYGFHFSINTIAPSKDQYSFMPGFKKMGQKHSKSKKDGQCTVRQEKGSLQLAQTFILLHFEES
jgi:hypothetical protein